MDRMITRSDFEKWLDLQPKEHNTLYAAPIILQDLSELYGGLPELMCYLRYRGIAIDREVLRKYGKYCRNELS